MAAQLSPPPPHDGSTGNLLQRAEPKVKAASLAAFLTPLALYYLYRYVPGISALPHELDMLLATLVTGVATFAAGYAARAVDRIDLLFGPSVGKAAAAVTRVGEQTIGARATDELESWVEEVGGKVAAPVKTAVVDAVHAVEAAAGSGRDPLAAAEDQVPDIVGAVHTAIADGSDQLAQAIPPVLEQVAADVPALAVEAAAATAAPKTADELMLELRSMIAMLDAGTPIADAAQADAASPIAASPATSKGQAPALAPSPPPPADPPTAPMAAVAAPSAT